MVIEKCFLESSRLHINIQSKLNIYTVKEKGWRKIIFFAQQSFDKGRKIPCKYNMYIE